MKMKRMKKTRMKMKNSKISHRWKKNKKKKWIILTISNRFVMRKTLHTQYSFIIRTKN